MNELLPIGSVVRVKNSPSVVMVIGYGPISREKQSHFDYLAVNYLFGFGSGMQTLMFDRSSIDTVLFTGHVDEKANAYRQAIDALIQKEEHLAPLQR